MSCLVDQILFCFTLVSLHPRGFGVFSMVRTKHTSHREQLSVSFCRGNHRTVRHTMSVVVAGLRCGRRCRLGWCTRRAVGVCCAGRVPAGHCWLLCVVFPVLCMCAATSSVRALYLLFVQRRFWCYSCCLQCFVSGATLYCST